MTLVERASRFLEHRISRRNLIVRSAFVGSALATGGLEFLLKPGTAYAQCVCGSPDCACGDTCCAGYTEFCCVLNGGYNSCPANTIMGGWWMAEGSEYCDGPRYYMDCNAVCECANGCSEGFPFCSTGCDGVTCGCAFGSCDNYLTSCFQFRYGQCNQDVECIGRIVCRVVTCVPPWEVDPTCTTASAEDDGTANQSASCLGPNPTYPPPPPPPPPPPIIPQEDIVAVAAFPGGTRVDVFVIGQTTLPTPGPGWGPVFWTAQPSPAAAIAPTVSWVNLGGMVRSVDAVWLTDGTALVVTAVGEDDDIFMNVLTAATKVWSGWRHMTGKAAT